MGERQQPLYSDHAEDPALSEAIDRFVLGLAEAVDDLQDTHSTGELARMGVLARELAVDADFLGYGPLARLAEAAASCAAHEKQAEARGILIELTGVAQRIRRGHRGAL